MKIKNNLSSTFTCAKYMRDVKKWFECFITNAKAEYGYLKRNLDDYRDYFGPFKDIIYTPYCHFSLILSLAISTYRPDNASWADTALKVFPSLLGFSMGGYAVIITFGDEKFRKFLAKYCTGDNQPFLFSINGVFIHLIACQTLSIFLAWVIDFICVESLFINIFVNAFFIYSLMLCILISFEIKTISVWYKKYIDNEDKMNS